MGAAGQVRPRRSDSDEEAHRPPHGKRASWSGNQLIAFLNSNKIYENSLFIFIILDFEPVDKVKLSTGFLCTYGYFSNLWYLVFVIVYYIIPKRMHFPPPQIRGSGRNILFGNTHSSWCTRCNIFIQLSNRWNVLLILSFHCLEWVTKIAGTSQNVRLNLDTV